MSTKINPSFRLSNGGFSVKSYYDPINQREQIRKDNNGKIGVYAR